MRTRHIATLLLVVAVVVPAATSGAVVQSQSPADQPAVASGDAADASNYTRLYVEDGYRSLDLKPGESDSFTVTVENGEDEAVTVDPHLYLPRVGDRPVEEEWVSIQGGETTLDAGEEQTVTVSVSVPESADLANYRGMVAFTNETVTYPGRPARPVHAASFHVEVYREPTVSVVDGEYMHAQVQAGESYTHSITVENTGEQAVPVNPKLNTDDGYHVVGGQESSFERSWVDIEAPSEIGAGETATVNVTITPPEDTDVGDYRAELDLGIKDPARDGRNNYWQRISLGVQVWEQPEDPYTTAVEVAEGTDAMTVKLSAPNHERVDTEPASFNVSLVAPDGTVIDAERVQTTERGHVDLAESEQSEDSAYGSVGGEQTMTYRVEEPAAGDWTVRIMPENTIQFGYEIVRNEG
jgi:hypothetical protein